ncbi:MAG TPA: GNAT family N-acetyltransferase [Turneriella sp.]|nr:GNAT family N-acetyltransferase [Turneriella sp.]
MTIEIHRLHERDFDTWLSLWKEYLLFYKSNVNESTTMLTWKKLLDEKMPMFAWGAFNDRKLVAFAHAVYHPSTWTVGDYCYLQDLFTHPQVRRQGIATKLIHAIYDDAQRHCASRVYWLTHETNVEAKKLYEKIAVRSGFIQYRKVLSL